MPLSYPHSNVFYRKLKRDYPRIVRGEGCYLYDDAGKRYLDAVGGAFVASLGHGNQDVADAMARQARMVAYVNGTAFTHDAVEELAAELAALAPGDLNKVYFLSSGSEAVEAALKLARQYWAELGEPGKRKIIALSPSYHGNTMLALSASARANYQSMFGDWLVDVRRVRAPFAYHCECRGFGADCKSCTGAALEEAIVHEGSDSIAAFIAEPIGGSSTGATVPRPEYWPRVREICNRHRVLFIADEILCGAGRTGTWSALEPFGVVPDIMTLGKGISGGYAPLSAVLAPERIVDVLARGSGSLLHAQTFSHHPVACAAGLETVRHIREHGLIERCSAMGLMLHERLAHLKGLSHVGDVRGRGLLAGIEFVEDVETRTPFPRALGFAEAFTKVAQAAGLVVWPNFGHAPGGQGDLVMVAPPYIVAEEEIAEIVALLVQALEATLRTIGTGVTP
ncbi:MAG: aspartate aminotransferase family protein [Gemmatimonadota bacterium]|nr:aspartate aminotransferase family protein [Gemmatimonadota bacterium]